MNRSEIEKMKETAAQWVGYKEKRTADYSYYESKDENAGMKNYTRFGRIADICIGGTDRRVKDGHAWCCMFLLALLYEMKAGRVDCTAERGTIEANAEALVFIRQEIACGGSLAYFAGVAAWLDSYRRRGRVCKAPADGDFVVFINEDGRPYHIGLVMSVKTDGTFTTVEGNTSATGDNVVANGGCVAAKCRKKNHRCLFLMNNFLSLRN